MMDLDGGGTIEDDELLISLQSVGLKMDMGRVRLIMREILEKNEIENGKQKRVEKVVGDSKQLDKEDLEKKEDGVSSTLLLTSEEEESNTSSMILEIDLPNFILFMVQFTKEQQMKLQTESLSDRSYFEKETQNTPTASNNEKSKSPSSQLHKMMVPSSNHHNFLSVGADISKASKLFRSPLSTSNNSNSNKNKPPSSSSSKVHPFQQQHLLIKELKIESQNESAGRNGIEVGDNNGQQLEDEKEMEESDDDSVISDLTN